MKVQDEEEEKSQWTTEDDPRKTRVGTFIRKMSIDELPQFFNVLKREMSVVGPRPERPFFVEQFKKTIPKYMVKHQVRPGLTGLAQVNGYRGNTSIEKRIEYDIRYVENWSLILDIQIMLKTIFKRDENAY
ncbi:MAG: sugar transferase, partial [Methanobrevibacter sp.]|nr:sugar transferase [Methanobrevibacter sp.]